MPRRPLVVLVVIGAVLLAGCDSDRRAISRDDLPEVPEAPDHVVELDDRGFDTAELAVRTDELVEFRIGGDDEHGIRSGTRIDTGLLQPGESTFVIFDEPGTYEVVDLADDDHVVVVESVEPDRTASG